MKIYLEPKELAIVVIQDGMILMDVLPLDNNNSNRINTWYRAARGIGWELRDKVHLGNCHDGRSCYLCIIRLGQETNEV